MMGHVILSASEESAFYEVPESAQQQILRVGQDNSRRLATRFTCHANSQEESWNGLLGAGKR